MRAIGNVLFVFGVMSIPLSYALFYFVDQYWGLFTGLWVPSTLLLSTRCHIIASLTGFDAEEDAENFGATTHIDAYAYYHMREAKRRAMRTSTYSSHSDGEDTIGQVGTRPTQDDLRDAV